MKNLVHCRGVLLLASLLLLSTSALAQATSSLRGTVTDTSGAVVPTASVTLSNLSTGFTRSTVVTGDGLYQFLQVPPGNYSLSVEAAGFRKAQLGVQLLVNTPTTADVMLQVGAESQVVTVLAEGATLNTEDATLGNAFQESQVKQLPIESRNVVDLLSLQAGVVYTGNRSDIDLNSDSRSGSVNGARSDQTTVTMDGIDVSDQNNGYAFSSVLRTTPDSLQEFRVTTTNPTAGDGSSAGAQVALVTKSGTNSLHGSLYEYTRNTATSANDYFIKSTQLASGLPNKPPKLIRNIFGGSVGGPIMKDQAFYFLNYEGRRDAEEQSIVRMVPTQTLRAGTVKYLYCINPTCVETAIQAVTPQDLVNWDPIHAGPNSTMLNYFQQSFPLPNDSSVGDGLNISGYRFAAPIKNRFDTYIARFDYRVTADGKHSIFWRGNAQDDSEKGVPFLPGLSPQRVTLNRSKGFALGYTAVLKPNLVNELRWGYTRVSLGRSGNSTQPWVITQGLDQGFTRSAALTEPIHNIVDNASWIRGRHTFKFGANVLFMRDGRNSLENSFSNAQLASNLLRDGGFANLGGPFDPAVHGFPAVAPTFATSYDYPTIDVLGIISQVNATYNFDKNGNALPQGSPVQRHYAINEYDFYFQDAIQLKKNLTLNVGLRYQLESPPWETNGLQVIPNVVLGEWLKLRGQHMNQGIPSSQDPVLAVNLGGPGNGKPSFYNWDYLNFAPRVSIAYSPRPSSSWLGRLLGEDKTVIRAGAGIGYDHFGDEILSSFDRNGTLGLSTTLSNPIIETEDCAPRVSDLHTIPIHGCPDVSNGLIMLPPPAGGFPKTFPQSLENGGFGTSWTVDRGLKTPYNYMLNLSVARELTSNMSVQLSYIGHLAHRLLSQEDFAMPMNIRDPSSGIDYWSALNRLRDLVNQGYTAAQITPALVGPTSVFWSNLFTPLTQVQLYSCAPGQCTPVQAAFDMEHQWINTEAFIPFFWDPPGLFCPNGCSSLGPYVFWDAQFFSLFGWTSNGNSNYHALQASFRKRLSHGIQFDLNYTYSKSMDWSSDAARLAPLGGTNLGSGGIIVNSWAPNQLRAVSDFDMTHQFNANWVAELPFGRGKRFAANVPGWVNAVIGGWQFSGIYRITSGLPFSVRDGRNNFPTNGGVQGSLATYSGLPVRTGTTKTDGKVLMFPDPGAAFNAFQFTAPGQSGSRNVLRGDGFLSWDSSLSKRWLMPYNEQHSLQFRWEVFNVGNFTRFNVQSNLPTLDQRTTFGTYTGLLTNPRVMQFALRYEF